MHTLRCAASSYRRRSGARLVARRHVDLLRVNSAQCRI
jgi:hypothetical protein